MSWIVAVVGLLLAVEYLLLEPIKREVERWREPGAAADGAGP
jgi:NitT/TauT family transport system permease protein